MMAELAALGWGRPGPGVPPGVHHAVPPGGAAGGVGRLRRPAGAHHDHAATPRGSSRRSTPSTSRSQLRRVDVPTLVLHARGDLLMPMAEGLRIAQLVPDSRFVSLDAPNHLLLGDEPAWPLFLDEVARFLSDA